MPRLLLLFLICLGCAGMAQAGAWPRAKGDVFLSLSTYSGDGGGYTGIYGEWGATDRLTFGADLGRSVAGASKTVVFARIPLWQQPSGHVLSAELGLGQIDGNPMLRPGLSWGKGLTCAHRSGWVGIDTLAEIDLYTFTLDVKADLTFGLSLSDARMMILQLQTGMKAGDDPFARIVPSLVFGRGGKRRLELGVTQGLWGDRDSGVKIAVWTEF